MDLNAVSNPAVSMEWTDASGVAYTGQTLVPAQATDSTGGALPGGSVRWRNVGFFEGQAFDLLVTVPSLPSLYSESVSVAYTSPLEYGIRQALSLGGFVCLGVGTNVVGFTHRIACVHQLFRDVMYTVVAYTLQ